MNSGRQMTDAMQMRIEGLVARNRELSNLRNIMSEEIVNRRGQVTELSVAVHDLNGRVQADEAKEVENAARYRRLNDNVKALLNYAGRMLQVVDRIQNEPASENALSQMLGILAIRWDGITRHRGPFITFNRAARGPYVTGSGS